MIKRKGPLLLLAVIGFFQAASLVRLVSVMPVYHHVDEAYHYDYILKLKQSGPHSSCLHLHPMILLSIREYGYDSLYYFAYPVCRKEQYNPDFKDLEENFQINQHPPLYYFILTFFVSEKSAPLTQVMNVQALRIIGIFLFLLGGILWASGLSRWLGMKRMNLLMLIMIWTWTPSELFRVSNDMGLFLISAVTVYVFSFTEGGGEEKRTWLSILLGLCLGACIWTKYNLIYLLLPALCMGRLGQHLRSIRYREGKRGKVNSPWKEMAGRVITDPAFLIFMASLILLRFMVKTEVYKPPFGPTSLKDVSFFHIYSKLIFGETLWLGKFIIEIKSLSPKILLVLFVIGFLCALLVRIKPGYHISRENSFLPVCDIRRRSLIFLLAIVVWMVFIQIFIVLIIPWFCQGRYWIPLVPFAISAMITGYHQLGYLFSCRWRYIFPILATATWVAINSLHLQKVIERMSM